ncbi:calcium-binding protein, partial [Thermodesulfobacteriota bacterium]
MRWTGADSVAVDARGAFMDGRKVVALERFYADPPIKPGADLSVLWLNTYHELSEVYYSSLMSKIHLQDLFDSISFYHDETAEKTRADLTSLTTELTDRLEIDPAQGKIDLSEFARCLRGQTLLDSAEYLAFRETFIQLDPTLGWVFDTGGLPVYDQLGQGTREWSPHIEGTNNADAVLGHVTEGDGTITSQHGDGDVIYGSSRDERLIQGTGDAVLLGEGGNDTILAGEGDDIIDGGAGNDMLYGQAGNDFYLVRIGSGHDTILDTNPDPDNIDTIWLGSNLTPEDISLERSLDNFILKIDDTSDSVTVINFFKNDSILNRIEQIQFMDGTVWTYLDMIRELFAPTDGDDIIYDMMDLNELSGGDGNDQLLGLGGDDILNGDGGDDKPYGGAGDDTLDGGGGNDYLEGWTGNDTYRVNRGSGQDVIADGDASAGNIDTIEFGADILPSDIQVELAGSGVRLTITDSQDSVTIYRGISRYTSEYEVEEIRFTDGTVWDPDHIKDILVTGTEADDTIEGFARPDSMTGLGGNDTLSGFDGDDTIDGGSGDDSLWGQYGNDTLIGGAGDDKLVGSRGDDFLDGGAGTDHLYGGAELANWRSLDDGNGNDKYGFGRDYGQDTITDRDRTEGNIDTIRLADDLTPDEVFVQRHDSDLVLCIAGTTDTLTVTNWFWNDSDEYKVERIEFGDGTVWNVETMREMVLQGTPGNDILQGYSGPDIIYGYDGNDWIFAFEGDDILDGGSGWDRLSAGKGNDILRGGDGDDELYGWEGDDVLDGGPGNDYLDGGESSWLYGLGGDANGNDTFLFYRDAGRDIVRDHDTTDGNVDTILLGEGIAPSDILLRRDELRLILSINDTDDILTVENWFFGDSGEFHIERIEFADGTVWDPDYVNQMLIQGTSGDDWLIGYAGSDTLAGLAGDDLLEGRGGDDILNGGDGNDTLLGGLGNDTYLVGNGSGQDTVIDWDPNAGNTDTILLGAGITAA